MSGACTIIVDHRIYEVEISMGSARARHGDLELDLPSWTATEHLDALRRHLVPGPAGLELDCEGYAAELLARTDIPITRWGELVPLALWWATRPDLDDATSNGASVVLHDGSWAELRDCTWYERIAAARHGLVRSDDGVAIDVVRVMERLLERAVECVVATGGQRISWQALGGSSVVRLSSVLLERSIREAPFSELTDIENTSEQARVLLELCRVLGRTPTQVFALPAAEVDLVRELLRRANVAAPSRGDPLRSRPHAPLHDAPDAIVIDFGGGAT